MWKKKTDLSKESIDSIPPLHQGPGINNFGRQRRKGEGNGHMDGSKDMGQSMPIVLSSLCPTENFSGGQGIKESVD